MIFIPLIFFLSLASARKFPGSVDKKIRENLLAALKRFHLNQPPLHISRSLVNTNASVLAPAKNPKPRLSREVGFEKLPVDLIVQNVSDFMDFKLITSLRGVSWNSRNISRSIVEYKLSRFCPHFVTDDFLLNDLLLIVIKNHFPDSLSLNSPAVRDELQVLILEFLHYDFDDRSIRKNIHIHLDDWSIPKNIYFYIITFINGMLNGINASVPITTTVGVIDSLRFVKENGNSRKTLKFLSGLFCSSASQPINGQLSIIARMPSNEELKSAFGITDINNWIPNVRLEREIILLVSETLIDEYRADRLLEFCRNGLCSTSTIITTRLISDIKANGLNYLDSLIPNSWTFELKYAICKSDPDAHLYFDCNVILTRITNDFPLQEEENPHPLLSSDPLFVESVLRSFECTDHRTNLYRIDIFSRCFHSPLISKSVREAYLNTVGYHVVYHSFYEDIITKEHVQSWCFFDLFSMLHYPSKRLS
jgi:hypothetical protein